MRHLKYRSVLTLLGLLAAASCRPRQESSDPSAQQFARRILGPAVDYQSIPAKADELNGSVALRRAHAWAVVEEALRPVEVNLDQAAATESDAQSAFGGRRLANWQTWYDRTEFHRLFEILYRCKMTTEERRAFKDPNNRSVVALGRVQQILAELPRHGMGNAWTAGRFRELLGQLTTANDLAGLNGVDGTGMSLYSPALVAHYLQNASAVYNCDGTQPAATELFGGCFGNKPFPAGAAAVKPTFNRVSAGAVSFDTSAKGLEQIFTTTGPNRDMWRGGSLDGGPQPVVKLDGDAGSHIYKVNYRQGDTLYDAYALTGMHIITKEIPEWVWTTLWWSDHPDTDFGADRPRELANKVDPIYANYKMCTATTFAEADPLVMGTAPADSSPLAQDLVAALQAAYQGTKPGTWCSNPFIEHMPHGARTNCVGCHQHAGPDGMVSATAQKPADLLQTEKRFLGDYMASFHGGKDDFQGIIQGVVGDVDLEGAEPDRAMCL